MGSLVTGRSGHSVLYSEDHFLVAGGFGTFKVEKCSLHNDTVTCEEQSPALKNYAGSPLMLLVTADYCKN